jgi:hypothetical protein
MIFFRNDWFYLTRLLNTVGQKTFGIYIYAVPFAGLLLEKFAPYISKKYGLDLQLPLSLFLMFLAATTYYFARLIYSNYCPVEIQDKKSEFELILELRKQKGLIYDEIQQARQRVTQRFEDFGRIAEAQLSGLFEDRDINRIIEVFKQPALSAITEETYTQFNLANLRSKDPQAQKICYGCLLISIAFSFSNLILLIFNLFKQI